MNVLAGSNPAQSCDTEPSTLQLYIWQAPLSMVNGSMCLFLARLSAFLAGRLVNVKDPQSGDEVKV